MPFAVVTGWARLRFTRWETPQHVPDPRARLHAPRLRAGLRWAIQLAHSSFVSLHHVISLGVRHAEAIARKVQQITKSP